MSLTHPWLIIDLDDVHYGLDALLVRESLWLPELTPIEEAPHHIVGMFSLRDQLIPVTDLNLRFGHPPRPYTLSDQLVVLEYDGKLMGVIVSEVLELIDLVVDAIQPALTFDTQTDRHAHLITGEARVGDGIVTLLDSHQLAFLQQELSCEEHPARHFCPEATPEQHAVFHARAKALLENTAAEEGERLALAVIELGGEYFGIELETVQEFCEIKNPCPIPCCPPHILGSMNLRGNLLTLLDLYTALNLPRCSRVDGKIVVARLGEETVGVAVDEVHDVIYLPQRELQPPPATLLEQRGGEIKGATPYADKMLLVLDLPALLAREEWLVNDSV
jgi:purine-binding chemotaxis protein CheW